MVSKVMHDGLSGNPWVQCWTEKEILKSCIIRKLKRRLLTMSENVTRELHNDVLTLPVTPSVNTGTYIQKVWP